MRFTLFIALLLLASCATGPQLTGPDTCGAARFGNLVGQSQGVLERTLILEPVRVIRPGDRVGPDALASRLNFHIDRRDRIARISCG